MENLLVFCALFFLILFIFLQFELRKLVKTNIAKTCNLQTSVKTLRPLPQLSVIKTLVWLFTFGNRRVGKALRYVGKDHKIVEFQFWKIRVAVINDLELGKQLFKNHVFCGKDTNYVWQYMSFGSNGVMNSSGKIWTEQKRFCFQHLKEFGFGTKSMETFIQNEIEQLIESWLVKGKNGEAFSPNQNFYLPVLNTIWTILAGERSSAENDELAQLVYPAYQGFAAMLGFPDFVACASTISKAGFNALMDWTLFISGVKLMVNSFAKLHLYFQRIIDNRKETIDFNESPRTLVDAYLKKIKETTDPTSEFFGEKGETHLIAVMTEFFMAGGDTTATMLVWAILHLVRNPVIQARIRSELDSVVGSEGRLSLLDRVNCPFTEAFMSEVLRHNPISTVSLPHAVTEDTNIGPYFIAKDTFLCLNIYNIQNDPKIWGDPENFRPERFLSEDGTTVVKPEAMCAFSLGLRRCFGEQLARDQMFLFIGSICKRFVLKPDPFLKTLPSIREKFSILSPPQTFKIVAVNRLNSNDKKK